MNKTPLYLITLLGAASVANAAVFSWADGSNGGEWSTAANWGSTEVPGDTAVDSARLYGGGDYATVTVDRDSSSLFDVGVRQGSSIDISANFGDVRRFDIGTTGSLALTSTINQSAGTTRFRDYLRLGTTGKNAISSYNVSGTANLTSFGAADITLSDLGVFSITGQAATVNFGTSAAINLNGSSALEFNLGTTGVSDIGFGGLFTIGAGASLNIDANLYTGGAQTFSLVNFGTIAGTFTGSNINISNLDSAFTAAIAYDADSMDLVISAVPEPSTYAMLAGLLALSWVMVRRR